MAAANRLFLPNYLTFIGVYFFYYSTYSLYAPAR
jgi:hypothetical protein